MSKQLIPTEAGGITLEPQAIPIDDFLDQYEEFEPCSASSESRPRTCRSCRPKAVTQARS